MPHKKAKRSIREQLRSQAGLDLAPANHSLTTETVPKSVARVLNAVQIRKEWKEKALKRKAAESGSATMDDGPGKKKRKVVGANANKIEIRPGETLAQFNKRVEASMAPIVRSAVQSSSAYTRKFKKSVLVPHDTEPKSKRTTAGLQTDMEDETRQLAPIHKTPIMEFSKANTAAPRRLNDIAQAPPEFKKLPRGAGSQTTDGMAKSKHSRVDVVSLKHKAMMEREREEAIKRYRVMKEQKRREAGISTGPVDE